MNNSIAKKDSTSSSVHVYVVHVSFYYKYSTFSPLVAQKVEMEKSSEEKHEARENHFTIRPVSIKVFLLSR